ncbi:homoserine kinase [Cryomorphaceae bacterium 1068]|nr:homoserine kinase [Cryomorphaceae bacterium 1068]
MKSITAFAPATLANFNVGYDILGLSLNNIGDEVELTFNNTGTNKIIEIINGDGLPYEVEKNCCSVVIRKMQEAQNDFRGVDIRLKKGFAAGSGLGSSSASSAAAAYGYNHLIDSPYTSKELVAFAAEGERVACGTDHVDNVAPSLLGGIILAKGKNPDDLIKLPLIDNLYIVTLYPNITVNTADSRKLLEDQVPLDTYIKQVAYMGTFVAGLYEKNLRLVADSLRDLVVEPARSFLIPHFKEMKSMAMTNDAMSFGISGSGPSIFALAEGEENAKRIEAALLKIYEDGNIATQTFINALVENSGARILNPKP